MSNYFEYIKVDAKTIERRCSGFGLARAYSLVESSGTCFFIAFLHKSSTTQLLSSAPYANACWVQESCVFCLQIFVDKLSVDFLKACVKYQWERST
jgi:hypothetical protein